MHLCTTSHNTYSNSLTFNFSYIAQTSNYVPLSQAEPYLLCGIQHPTCQVHKRFWCWDQEMWIKVWEDLLWLGWSCRDTYRGRWNRHQYHLPCYTIYLDSRSLYELNSWLLRTWGVSQVSLRYLRTGIVLKAIGSFELKNVCLALAGSLAMNREVNIDRKGDNGWPTYLADLMHELELVPVPFVEIKIRITFSFQISNFITLICQLGKMVERLSEWIRSQRPKKSYSTYLPQ